MEKKLRIITKNAAETRGFGKKFAKGFGRGNKFSNASFLGLEGQLGGGKTTFLQGFAKGLGIKDKITSPTFIIFRKYRLPAKSRFSHFYHFDLYRMKKARELDRLRVSEIFNDNKNIIAAEWPKMLKKIFPRPTATLSFKYLGPKIREIIVK